eukprot:scaffold34585_cov221-Amphora_coffeaeformis.AAC.5
MPLKLARSHGIRKQFIVGVGEPFVGAIRKNGNKGGDETDKAKDLASRTKIVILKRPTTNCGFLRIRQQHLDRFTFRILVGLLDQSADGVREIHSEFWVVLDSPPSLKPA